MRPAQELSAQENPVVDQHFDWISNTQLQYTFAQIQAAPRWILQQSNDVMDPQQLLNELPFVAPEDLNYLQRVWFDMVMQSYNNNVPVKLIINGTAGTGKSHTISAISHAIPAEQLVRCAFTA